MRHYLLEFVSLILSSIVLFEIFFSGLSEVLDTENLLDYLENYDIVVDRKKIDVSHMSPPISYLGQQIGTKMTILDDKNNFLQIGDNYSRQLVEKKGNKSKKCKKNGKGGKKGNKKTYKKYGKGKKKIWRQLVFDEEYLNGDKNPLDMIYSEHELNKSTKNSYMEGKDENQNDEDKKGKGGKGGSSKKSKKEDDYDYCEPSSIPTGGPSLVQSDFPSEVPTDLPSSNPTYFPTVSPTTTFPSTIPSIAPTNIPTTYSPTVCYNGTREEGIIEVISNSVSDSSPLQDPNSDASLSLNWLINEDTSNLDACAPNLVQRWTLGILYFAMGAANWKDKTGWLVNEDECTWYGLGCNEVADGRSLQQESRQIVSIELVNNEVTGKISSNLNLLRQLEEISFYQNFITGSIPEAIFTLTELKIFDVEVNQMTGTLSPNIKSWPNLKFLGLSNNTFTGSLSSEVGALTSLKSFWIANNEFDGTLPDEINLLTKLRSMQFYSNKFTGILPSMEGLTKLEVVRLDSNLLGGTIPVAFYEAPALRNLTLSSNEFTGSVSPALGTLSNLQSLGLNNNKFTGIIPELGMTTGLYTLDLQQNEFTGEIPSTIGNQKNLTFINLSNNSITGPIHEEFWTINTLRYIYLSNNNLNGTLSSNISNLTNVEDLWLDGNKLSGPLPSIEAGTLGLLEELLLNFNDFTGEVPDSICNLRSNSSGVLEKLWHDCSVLCPADCCTFCVQ